MRKMDFKKIAELVVKVKAHDPDAFVELYNYMYQDVYFLALSIVKDEYLAQDAVQETFIKVYKSIDTLNSDMSFIAWINRIAYNYSLKMLQKNGEIPLENEMMEQEYIRTEEEPLESVLSKEKTKELMELILELPPEYKVTMILKYYDDMKMEEIANCLDCSVGTVKSRLNRGKSVLRKRMIRGGKMFAFLAVSSLSLGFAMTSYAKENAMTLPVANSVLGASKRRLGITSTMYCQSIVPKIAPLGLKKVILISSSAAIIGMGGIVGSEKVTITISYPSSGYTSHTVTILAQVDSTVPVKETRVISQEKSLSAHSVNQTGSYEAKICHNGQYQFEVVLWSGRKVTKEFEVNTIDTGLPELYWHSWNTDKDTLYCLVTDDMSGVDYTKIYKEDLEGNRFLPIRVNEETGEVEFQLSEAPFFIHLTDKADNYATYRIEPYKTEIQK